jgi:hypothetical protein
VFSSTIIDPLTGKPFPNNTIPANRINPVSAKLLNDFIPVAPSTNGGQLVTSGSNPTNVDQYVGKMDALLTSRDHLSVSYFYDRTVFDTPFASGPYPAYGQRHEDQVIPVLAITETHNFSPTMINQFRGGRSGQEENRGCNQSPTPRSSASISIRRSSTTANVGVDRPFQHGGRGSW